MEPVGALAAKPPSCQSVPTAPNGAAPVSWLLACDSQGIVGERAEGDDWHGVGSYVIGSIAESVDRKAEPVSDVLSLSCIPRAACNAARMTWIAVVLWTRQPRQ